MLNASLTISPDKIMAAASSRSVDLPSEDVSELMHALPVSLHSSDTTITRAAVGNSGAGVFLVDAGGARSVLKMTALSEPLEDWHRAVATQRAAAQAGVAPRVLHVDEVRRAVLSEHVVDRSLAALYWNPATRRDAIAMLANTARAVHAIAPLASHPKAAPFDMLAKFWSGLQGVAASERVVPQFALDAWQRVLHDDAPDANRAMVLCHNDMNPSNLVFDGERLLLFDWQTTAINDPYYDLGTMAVFLRMDEPTALQLLSAYHNTNVEHVPERFNYFRRVSATLSGSAFLYVARQRGYAMPNLEMSRENASALGDIYAELRSGALNLGMPEAQWRFGLALLKESTNDYSPHSNL